MDYVAVFNVTNFSIQKDAAKTYRNQNYWFCYVNDDLFYTPVYFRKTAIDLNSKILSQNLSL